MNNYYFLLFFFVFSHNIFGQVGIGTEDPDVSSALEISASNAGVLIPRVSLLSSTDQTTIPAPVKSLLVYNLNTSATVVPGFYYWGGDQWHHFTPIQIGDNKWDLFGNAGTDPSVNFLGTTDDKDVLFKRNKVISGILGAEFTTFGVDSEPHVQGQYAAENTALGAYVLKNNNTGRGNTGIGHAALTKNDGGEDNTAIGRSALKSLINTRTNNTAIGAFALMTDEGGSNNTAVGTSSLQDENASNNTAIGMNSLKSGGSTENVAIGHGTLENNTDFNNTASGINALHQNTSGQNNTASGISALKSNTSGRYNTALGAYALENNTLGNAVSSAGNTAIGKDALRNNISGSNNTAVGGQALLTVITSSNNTAIGFNAQTPNASESNQIRIGNSDVEYAGIQVAWSISSDNRWKSEVKDMKLGLQFINQLRPVSYYRKNDKNKTIEYGFIAQELKKTLNRNGAFNNGMVTEDDNGMLGVRYNDLFSVTVKAIQEQQNMLEQQQKRIIKLEERMDTLEL